MRNLRKMLGTKDARALMENFFSLSALQLIGIVLPLITLPYVLRVLGKSYYGEIVFVSSLVNYFMAITDYSFRLTATREIARSRHSKRQQSYVYSRVLTVRTLLCVVSIIAIFLIVMSVPMFRGNLLLYALTAPILVGNVLFPEWFFQGIEKMKYITFLNLGIKVFFTLCIFVFIHEQKDYWMYPMFFSLGYIVSGCVGDYIVRRKFGLSFSYIGRRRIVRTLKDNFPVFINQFLPNLYNNTSTFLLGIFASSELVGTYDAIRKVADLFVTITGVTSKVAFPYLVRKSHQFAKYMKAILTLALVYCTLPVVFSSVIFWYLEIHTTEFFFVLPILMIGVFCIALYDVFGVNYFISRGMYKVVMRNTVTASVVGFVLSLPMIYLFGIYGAAANLTISRSMMGVGMCRKYLIMNKKNKTITATQS